MPQIFVNLLSLQSLKNFKHEILEKLVPKAILQVESVNIIKIWILILVHCTCSVLYKTVEGLVTTQLLLCHGGKNCQNWVKILNSIFTYLIFLPGCQIVWHLHDTRRKDFCFVIMLILFFFPVCKTFQSCFASPLVYPPSIFWEHVKIIYYMYLPILVTAYKEQKK